MNVGAALRGRSDIPWLRIGPGGELLGFSAEAVRLMDGAVPPDLTHALNLPPEQLQALLASPEAFRGEATLFRGESPPVQVKLSGFADDDAVLVLLVVDVEPLIVLQTSFSAVNSQLTNVTRDRAKQSAKLVRALQDLEAQNEEFEQQNRELQDAYRRLDEAHRQLAEEDRLKARFYAQMNHELRTPLNSIIGFAEDALDGMAGPINDDLKLYFDTILHSGQRQLALVNDLLDLAKLKSGKSHLNLGDCSLRALISDVARVMQPLMQRRRQVWEMECAEPLLVRVDPLRISQVLMNLVSNAHKFTPDGGTISVRARREGACARIDVADTGRGIHSTDLQRLFDEFYQVKRPSGTQEAGTGLGLAITRQLVDLHDGTISVVSEPGQGSCFSFTLPLATA